MSQFTRFARVIASKNKGKDFQIYAIKTAINSYPNIIVEYRGMERVNGENAHIFHLLIPKGTDSRYAGLKSMIGDTFYQGNQFVIYKWVDHTPNPTPVEPTPTPYIGYKMTNTWGAEIDPSIEVFHYKRRV
jgi:hypothetical protein